MEGTQVRATRQVTTCQIGKRQKDGSRCRNRPSRVLAGESPVIWESSYRKEDLGRLADKLKARKVQKKFPARSLACLEKEIFIGCYIIRKLMDGKKLSDTVASLKFPVRFHSSIGRNPTWLTWNQDLDRSYDFKNVHTEPMSLPYLCNQLIHSFIFVPLFGRHGTLRGIFFNSDLTKSRKLYYLSISTLEKIFRKVATNYPWQSQISFDPFKQDYSITQE